MGNGSFPDGGGKMISQKIELADIADMMAYKIIEMIHDKDPEYGSITFTFSPASDTVNCRVETSRRIPIKALRAGKGFQS
jgi:hypothetical protein